jgi:hypothetical protein
MNINTRKPRQSVRRQQTLLMIVIFWMASQAFAEPGKRSTAINFEDEVVEGINRKPLDSVNQISERDGKGRQHLYKKRAGFIDRDQALLEDMRLQQ